MRLREVQRGHDHIAFKSAFVQPYRKKGALYVAERLSGGVLLTLRHLCEPRRRRESTQEVWEAILEKFVGCADIDFAYPTSSTFTLSSKEKIVPGLAANPSEVI